MNLLIVLLSVALLTQGASHAAVTARKDAETGNTMYVVTDTPGMNTIGYPTCRSWSKDGKGLFIESSRPRPDGTQNHRERQLLQVDIADGKVTHLASLVAEDTAAYGKAQGPMTSAFHADYAPEANTLVYFDFTGHNMYLLDLDTGRRERVLHEPEGTLGCPPSISWDGKRVVYFVVYPAIENRYFTEFTSVILVLDVDPATLKPIGEPRVVVAYPGRKGPDYANNKNDRVHVDHCQVNPRNNDHISYAHDFSGCERDGGLLKTRLWQVMADGSRDRPFVIQQRGEGHTHEIFGPKGDKIYFVSIGLVYSADFESGQKKLVFDGTKYGASHVAVSQDERWMALDLWFGQKDEHGNIASGILLVDLTTGKERMLCKIRKTQGHPGHPHPSFSPDGTKIAFTIADGKNTQVAYVVIDECK